MNKFKKHELVKMWCDTGSCFHEYNKTLKYAYGVFLKHGGKNASKIRWITRCLGCGDIGSGARVFSCWVFDESLFKP